jgi:quercetin dioxygenase-like cupin family protein
MTRYAVVALLLGAACFAQSAAPVSDSQVPQPKELLKNSKVDVSLLTFAPGEGSAMHKHERDYVAVFVTGGQLELTQAGQQPTKNKLEAGEVRFRNAGVTHSAKNIGTSPFWTVIVEFADAQGKVKRINKKSQTCAPGTKTCVEEKELFCTEKVCVEEVKMAPGAVTVQHSHATDHMLVAVSDYELTDEVEGKGTVVRRHKSGEVEYIPAGITHRLTNTGKDPAYFTVILWK